MLHIFAVQVLANVVGLVYPPQKKKVFQFKKEKLIKKSVRQHHITTTWRERERERMWTCDVKYEIAFMQAGVARLIEAMSSSLNRKSDARWSAAKFFSTPATITAHTQAQKSVWEEGTLTMYI